MACLGGRPRADGLGQGDHGAKGQAQGDTAGRGHLEAPGGGIQQSRVPGPRGQEGMGPAVGMSITLSSEAHMCTHYRSAGTRPALPRKEP